MRCKIVCISSLVVALTILFLTCVNHSGPIAWAQVDGSALVDWLYPGAEGGANSSGEFLTTAMLWTNDDFKTVVQFYALKAGYDIQDAQMVRFINRAATGVTGGKDNTFLIEQRPAASTAVVVKRDDKRSISAYIIRAFQEDERTRILLVSEERSPRKLPERKRPVRVPLKQRLPEYIKDVRQWECPGAEPSGYASGDSYKAVLYATTEPLAGVLSFYKRRVGITTPTDFFVDTPSAVASDGDGAIASSNSLSVRMASFVKCVDGQSYVILTARALAEEQTHFTLLALPADEKNTAAEPLEEGILQRWEPKGGKQQRSAAGRRLRIATYITQESYKSVAEDYALRVGATRALYFEAGSGSSGTSDGVILHNNRPDVQSLTFFKSADKHSITIVLTRGANEAETHVTVIGLAR